MWYTSILTATFSAATVTDQSIEGDLTGNNEEKTNENHTSQEEENQMDQEEDKENQFSFFIFPQDIRPLPKKQTMSKKKGGRKKGSTAVLTSSPYKNMLEEEKKKQEALEAKCMRLDKKKGQEVGKDPGLIENDNSSRKRVNRKRKTTDEWSSSSEEDNTILTESEEVFSNDIAEDIQVNRMTGKTWVKMLVT
ncbi:hypothetical protein JTB14_034057 [Gonioctena quinquepunctata]|nr:hypothetical protein JTB14_034057 [Gonioctena quinquepunctata]